MKRVLASILVLALLALAAWFVTTRRNRAEGPLEFHGNVDIREVNLGFRVGGRLAEVTHEEGDAVAGAEVLARLDAEPYRRAADEAKAQVASLQARLRLLEAGNRPQEIAQAAAVVREREVTAGNARVIFERLQSLFAARMVSQQERDDAEARLRESEARLKSSQEQLKLIEAGFRPEEIAQAQADLARAEAALASANLQLKDTVLESPAAGVILTRAQEPGAILQAGASVLTLSLRRPVWVRAYITEPELGKIQPGTRVEVRSDSRPDKPYAGKVGYISPRAEFTPRNVETRELRTSLVYRFRVVVEEADEGLRQGMPVTVTVSP